MTQVTMLNVFKPGSSKELVCAETSDSLELTCRNS